MITVLPDNSFQLPHSTEEVQPSMVPPTTKEIRQVDRKRVFSASNIIIGLIVLSLVAGSLYFYLPDSKVQKNNITKMQNTLLDISQLPKQSQGKSGKPIMHPNDGSNGGSSATSASSNSNSNDKSNKHSKPISKNDKSTIIGGPGGAPGDGNGDDEDKQKKDQNNKKPALSSQPQEEQSQSDDEEDQETDLVNNMEQNWVGPLNQDIPLVGNIRN